MKDEAELRIEQPAGCSKDWLDERATQWRLRTRTINFPRRPLVMGIVNVTPDSFSDGGKYVAAEAAVEHALQLVEDGADMLDIGGESTRPYAVPVDAAEESRRVLPVLEKLLPLTDVPVSIDTSKSLVAKEALERGVEIVNDVSGLTGDARMLDTVLQYQPGVCIMHMRGTPQTMQDDPQYQDVVDDIGRYLADRRAEVIAAGLSAEQICLDPGIGFGKTHQHNLDLVNRCDEFHALGSPLLIGHSRKGFIGKILGNAEADRTAGTIGVALVLAQRGVQVVRVHDVAPVKEALLLFEACGGIDRHVANVD